MTISMQIDEEGKFVYSVDRTVINTIDDDTVICNKIMKCSTITEDIGFMMNIDKLGNGFIVYIPSSMSNPIKNWICQGIDNGLNIVLQEIK